MSKLDAAKKAIIEQVEDLLSVLLEKNAKYGNSAFEPVRIFSKANPEEQINVRLDDKLSRIMRGDSSIEDEDVTLDLMGYLILKRAFKRYQEIIEKENTDGV